MIDPKVLKGSMIKSCVRSDDSFTLRTVDGDLAEITDDLLEAMIEARAAARRAASASYKIYATDADGSERMFGILSATDVEDAIAKGRKAGYEVTGAVKL